MNLEIAVSKTANGKMEYLQIISEDQFSVNLVLIVDKVTIKDMRK